MDDIASPAAVLAIQVKANTSRANAALMKSDAQLNKTRVSANKTEGAFGKLGTASSDVDKKLSKLSGRKVNIDVDPGGRNKAKLGGLTVGALTASKAMSAVSGAASAAGEGLSTLTKASGSAVGALAGLGSGAGSAASQIAALGPVAMAIAAVIAGVLVVAVVALAGALTALVASLSAAVAAIAVMGVALGAAAGAAVLFGVAFAKAMKANGPAIQKFKEQIKGLGVTLRNAAGPGIQAFIGRLGPAIGSVRDLINGLRPSFLSFGRAAGGSVALIADGFKQLGPEIRKVFSGVSKLMTALAPAVAPLAGVFLDLANAAMPFLIRGAELLTRWVTNLRGTTSNAKLMRGVIQTLVGHFSTWWNILRQVGRIIFAVFRGGAKEGKNLGDSIGGALKNLADFLNSTEGQQKLHNFFRNMISIVRGLWRIFMVVTKAAIWMGHAIAAALNFIIPKARVAAQVIGTVFGGALRGVAAAARWVGGAVRAAFNGIVTAALWVGRGILGMVSKFLGGIQTMVATMAKIPGVGKAFRGLADQIGGAKRRIDSLRGSLAAANPAYSRTANAIRDMTVRGRGDLNRLAANARTNMQAVRKHLGENSAAGRKAVQHNFGVARDKIISAMKSGKISVKDASSRIAELQRIYGIKGAKSTDKEFGRAKRFMRNHIGGGASAVGKGMKFVDDVLAHGLRKYGAKPMKGGAVGGAKSIGDIVGRQRGGHINQGKPSGDSVPAMLERGEYVLNRKAVKQTGVQKLNALNYGQAPRFQQGGPVGMAGGGMVRVPGDPDTTGGRDKVAAAIASAVGSFIKRFGIQVNYGYDPGGGHKSPGHNVTGTALDVGPNTTGWDGVNKAVGAATKAGKTVYYDGRFGSTALAGHGEGNHAHIEWGLKGGVKGGAAAQPRIKIPRYVLSGGADFGRSGQAALDKSHGAAQKALDRARPKESGLESTGAHPGKGIASRAQMVRWARAAMLRVNDPRARPTAANINKILSLAMKESSWKVDSINNWDSNAKAGNPSGGLMHITKDKVGGSMKRLFDPVDNIATSIRYQLGKYGNLVTMSPYREGGLVGDPMQMLAKGGLAGQVGATSKLFGSKGKKGSPTKRSKNLSKLIKNIRGWGLKPSTQGAIDSLTSQASQYGEYADRAQQLTSEGGDGQAAAKGMVNGLDEGGWLTKQLTSLFLLRNKLAEAAQALKERQQAQMAALAKATRDHGGFVKRIKGGDKTIKRFSKSKAGKTKAGKRVLKGMKDTQTRRKRARDVLKNRVMPTLGDEIGKAGEKRSEIGEALNQVQGTGSPMGKLNTLPAVGTLGGDIFNTQIRLRDLGQKTTGVTDNSSERADMLATQSREWQQRYGVSQAQYKVFKDLPFAGSFGGGGVVSGSNGAAKQAVVHSGEGVFTKDQMSAMGGGVPSNLTIVLDDRRSRVIWGDQEIRAVVQDETRKQARPGNRPLPGSR